MVLVLPTERDMVLVLETALVLAMVLALVIHQDLAEEQHFIYTKHSACRWTLWLMQREMQISTLT